MTSLLWCHDSSIRRIVNPPLLGCSEKDGCSKVQKSCKWMTYLLTVTPVHSTKHWPVFYFPQLIISTSCFAAVLLSLMSQENMTCWFYKVALNVFTKVRPQSYKPTLHSPHMNWMYEGIPTASKYVTVMTGLQEKYVHHHDYVTRFFRGDEWLQADIYRQDASWLQSTKLKGTNLTKLIKNNWRHISVSH